MFWASTTTVAPPTDLPSNLSHFSEVSENDILKNNKNSPQKSCLLEPVPTFLLKDCVDIMPPSTTKLVNLSLVGGVFFSQTVPDRWGCYPGGKCHDEHSSATLFSGVCPVSTCTNCSVFKVHLVGLSQTAIDTNGPLQIISKNSIGCYLNFGVFSKLPPWFITFFNWVTQTISTLICLFIVEDMAQDTTAQLKGSWGSSRLPICTKIQKHFDHSFAFDAPTL